MGEGVETSTRFNKVRMTAQCPIVFHSLLEAEKIKIDVMHSLNLALNENSIRSSSGSDGGKSGEFFFFSHDNRLMLKTITMKEY